MSQAGVNLLLSVLSSSCRRRLLEGAKIVPLPLHTPLYEAEQTPEYAYFLTSGIASVVTTDLNGASAEVGLIGREGMVGALHLLGPAQVPSQCFIQLEATALKVRLTVVRAAFKSYSEIRNRILESVQEQALSLGQIAGCHRLHDAEERLARWLLMAQDRTGLEVLHFTQEFLAMMLGARRTTVTVVAGALQHSGLIEYRRGRVTITSRANLEAVACECYQVTKRLYCGLYK